MASVAIASDDRNKPSVRPVLLSEHPDNATHRVYVKGQVVTTLRFEKPVDPSKTKMISWEGRLEPLAVVRNNVFLEPIHDLNDDEGIPLVVRIDPKSVGEVLKRRRVSPDIFRQRESIPPDGA